ncbi:hypothetical protein EDC94DRAFT_605106 [Helicostylum pulchrum]|nr:hypothetical protein EDC94DRAFT_605106 [Helicostylum pulchrum]
MQDRLSPCSFFFLLTKRCFLQLLPFLLSSDPFLPGSGAFFYFNTPKFTAVCYDCDYIYLFIYINHVLKTSFFFVTVKRRRERVSQLLILRETRYQN